MKSQGLPKVLKSLPNIPHVCQHGSPRCHNGTKRLPKVLKRHHKEYICVKTQTHSHIVRALCANRQKANNSFFFQHKTWCAQAAIGHSLHTALSLLQAVTRCKN